MSYVSYEIIRSEEYFLNQRVRELLWSESIDHIDPVGILDFQD
jgi:aminoglycoside/choline kinase family phosphotransferase